MKKYQRKLGVIVAVSVLIVGSVSVSAAGIRNVFDAKYYADTYQDLKDAFGYDEEALFQHFMTYGVSEGRSMNPVFDVQAYRAAYDDLDAAFGDNWDAYVEHYITYGASEGRTVGILFDPVAYAEAYPDVAAVFGDDYAAIVGHYLTYGVAEGRTAGVIVTTAPAQEASAAATSSSSSSSGSETTTSDFTVLKTFYAELNGTRVAVTASNAATYFEGKEDGSVSLKTGVKIYDGPAGAKITAAGNYVTGTASSMTSLKSVYTLGTAVLSNFFEIGDDDSVTFKSGDVVGLSEGSYVVITGSNASDYVEVTDGALSVKEGKSLYALTAVSDLTSYFSVAADGTVTLKGSTTLLGDKTTVVTDSNVSTYVKGTAASMTLNANLYSDAASTKKITDATTIFEVAANGTVTLKSGATAYVEGGKEINASQIGTYLKYTPAETDGGDEENGTDGE